MNTISIMLTIAEIKNQIFTGDCRKILADFEAETIASCITDPPYNYEFIGHKWETKEIERRIERVQSSKTLVKNIPYGSGLSGGVRNKSWYKKNAENVQNYQEWCFSWAEQIFRVCKPGALVAIFNSTRTFAHIQIAFEKAGFYSRDCIVYRRQSGIPKGNNIHLEMEKKGYNNSGNWEGWNSCLRNEWEAIYIGQKPLINNYLTTLESFNVGLFYTKNGNGTFQSNIIEGIHREKTDDYNIHCTIKPLKLMEKLVKMLVPPLDDNIVLDPFAGSGTTLLAASNLKINYVGIEIEKSYTNIIKKRLKEKPMELF